MAEETGETYETPEEAARGDIPAEYAKALSVEISPSGEEALVVLATNEQPYIEPYEVVCYREGNRWLAGIGSGGLGCGWSSTLSDDASNTGVLRLSGEAPRGVDAVVVRWAGEEQRVPVTSGYFFFTRWAVPSDFHETVGSPVVTAYVRADGSTEVVPPDPNLERAWKWMSEHHNRGER
jgi:hypothetical protein